MQKQKYSVLGINWQKTVFDARFSSQIRQSFSLSEVISDIISSKKIDFDEIDNFLEPKIKTSLPNPFDLLDMKRAVDFVVQAIQENKKITIFADYDVDGATSSATLKKFFQQIGVKVEIYVPDRVLEGYGPNVEALLNLKKNGTDLVITVDCGTVAFAPLEAAKNAGLDIIVIDHHLGVLEKPQAIAVINPNRLDEKFPHKNLCAAGVSFLFAVAINKTLRDLNFYQNKKGPNLLDLLDLTALGTVCDVMPLTGLNRTFVAQGLKIIKQRKNLGIREICDLAKLEEEPNAYHLGFVIGPRINAGGRLGTANLGARILSSDDEEEVLTIANQLENFNNQRKEVEAQALQEAISQIENKTHCFSTNDAVIFAIGSWHLGVIGIIASRLKDLYNKPVAILTSNGQSKKLKASCRSINGIDFGNEILKARLQGILLEGGGHAMAGGFSVAEEKVKELHQFFCQNLAEKVQEICATKTAEFFAYLDLAQVNIELLKELSKLEPFGVGNVKPKFILRDLVKIKASLVGQKKEHLSCIFSSKTAIGFNSQIQAIAFKAANSEVAKLLLDDNYKKPIDVAGTLNINSWMGIEKVQIVIEDVLICNKT